MDICIMLYNYHTLLDVIDYSSEISPKHVRPLIRHLTNEQLESKKWVCDELETYMNAIDEPNVLVLAGWFGLLAQMNRNRYDAKVTSIDIDPMCAKFGRMLYDKDITFKHKAIEDFGHRDTRSHNIIICTSCEHVSDEVLHDFLSLRELGTLVILQSNNYYIPEHINCKPKNEDFVKSLPLRKVLYSETMSFERYDRYLVIGL